jgi:hypothetical protein
LLQFGIVLAALLHDAGHEGGGAGSCHNEDHSDSMHNGSPAVDKALYLLFDDSDYCDLRGTICSDTASCRRLHQLLIDAITATKAFDANLQNRPLENKGDKVTAASDNPGTVAMEALMQASDVLHTMQPWAVYREWNERLFAEHYRAFKEGKTEVDPSGIWFKAEIAF